MVKFVGWQPYLLKSSQDLQRSGLAFWATSAAYKWTPEKWRSHWRTKDQPCFLRSKAKAWWLGLTAQLEESRFLTDDWQSGKQWIWEDPCRSYHQDCWPILWEEAGHLGKMAPAYVHLRSYIQSAFLAVGLVCEDMGCVHLGSLLWLQHPVLFLLQASRQTTLGGIRTDFLPDLIHRPVVSKRLHIRSGDQGWRDQRSNLLLLGYHFEHG